MIIECTSCHSRYQYDEDRFDRKPSKKIKCAKCGSVFEIFNPAFAKPTAPADAGDMTFARKSDRPTVNVVRPRAASDVTDHSAPLPVRPAADQPQLPVGKRLSLAVINGPDAGSVFRLDKARVTIGRASADITLNDSEASRAHAAVEVRDTMVSVEDLGSTNGTIIDGVRIEGKTEIQDKAEFQVGTSTLMLIVTEDA